MPYGYGHIFSRIFVHNMHFRGVSYCFGSALIEHYKQIYSESVKEGDDIIVTLLGNEEYRLDGNYIEIFIQELWT